ncbi:MAG: TatD family hydrolase [Ignavibacteriota bacterium]
MRSASITTTTFRRAMCKRATFEEQLALATECGKPIVIHTREAWDDTVEILRAHWHGGGILHCFTGNTTQARQALDLGFHLSFGGVLTFPKPKRCANPHASRPTIVSSSRRIARTSRPCHIAENATNRPSYWTQRAVSPKCAAWPWKPSPKPPPKILNSCCLQGGSGSR